MKTLKAKKIIIFFSTLGLLNSILVQLGLFFPAPKFIAGLMGLDTKIIIKLTYPLVKLISLGYSGETAGFEYILLPSSGVVWGAVFGVVVYFLLSVFRGKRESE